MSKRRRSTIHEDTIDSLLDRLSDMREEVLAIERSLERIQAAKLEQGKNGSGKNFRIALQLPSSPSSDHHK